MSGLHFPARHGHIERESPIHALDPRVKLILTVSYIVCVGVTPEAEWVGFGLLGLLAALVAVVSQLGLLTALRRSAVVLPFALAGLGMVVSVPGRAIFSVPVLGWELSATVEGLVRFTTVFLKSWLSVQMAIVLTGSTPFTQLLQAMRDVGLPKVMVAITGFAYRYLFVIGSEAVRMDRARAARRGATRGRGGRSLKWRAQVTGSMAGSLFVRSIERSERTYDAMVARGYDGEIRSLHPANLEARDIALALVFLMSLISISVAVWLR